MPGKSAVCTLFEGNYHHGVAVLINSLLRNGFSGSLFVGYKGELSGWCSKADQDNSVEWPGARSLTIDQRTKVYFLPAQTARHLAHYKPDFMLSLLEGPARAFDDITYFDPDIVVKCPWNYFSKWINYGVAIVHEIIMNDMPDTHPIRMEWKEIISKNNKQVRRQLSSYLNCGFCGVSKKDTEFLSIWSEMIDLAVNFYKQDPTKFASFDRTSPFWSIDQDTFNITAMCCNVPISESGPEAMDFIHGGQVMSHAVGSLKPWSKNYFISALKGLPPSSAEKSFWQHVDGPIRIYEPFYVKRKKLAIGLASLIGRFYRRA